MSIWQQLSTTNVHHTGIASIHFICLEFIRNNQWPPTSPDPWTTMTGVQCWRPITSSTQNPSQSPNSKKYCRWSGTACHSNESTRLLKASHYDWRDAQKPAVNNSSTQTDCWTWKCSPSCFSDTVLLCFGANVFQHAKIAK